MRLENSEHELIQSQLYLHRLTYVRRKHEGTKQPTEFEPDRERKDAAYSLHDEDKYPNREESHKAEAPHGMAVIDILVDFKQI